MNRHFESTGIIISYLEYNLILQMWVLNQMSMKLCEQAYINSDLDLIEYAESICSMKLHYTIWTIAARYGITDKSKSLYVMPLNRELVYEVR